MYEFVSGTLFNDTEFRLIIGSTGIEYDPDKEETNRKKHGYSLESAVYILERAILPLGHPPLFTSDPIERNGEIRHNHLAVDDQKRVVFIATTMRPNEKVRVISFRTAHENERLLYTKLCKAILNGSGLN
jgi:uncharacterized DUF497 family protein